jgi:hypothetical protein
MILSVNLVAGHQYWKAGTDVPDELVPPFARQWAIDEKISQETAAAALPKKPLPAAVRREQRLLRQMRAAKR